MVSKTINISTETLDDPKITGASQHDLVHAERSESRKLYQYLAALSATLGAFAMGTVLGWTSPALPKLKSDPSFSIGRTESSLIGSLMNIGALFSGPAMGFCIEKFGRKRSMLVLTIPFLVGWILIIAASNVGMIYAGRLITGFCAGAFSLGAPVYIAETAEVSIRGTLGSFFQLMVTVGILFVNLVGWGLSWMWLSVTCSGILIIFVVTFGWMPESPGYLVKRDNEKGAENALKKLRGKHFDIQPELDIIKRRHNDDEQEEATLRDLFSSTVNLKLLSVSFGLMIFQQLSGVNAVIFYTVDIFAAAGSSLDSNISSIIIGVVQCITTLVSTVLVDRTGRKILLLVSGGLMTLSNIALGIFFYIKHNDPSSVEYLGWLPLTSLVVFIVAFSIGYGPIPWLIMGEIFPSNIKGFATSFATSLNWLLSFIVTLTFDYMVASIKEYGTFWLFSGFCVTGFVLVLVFLRETKGKTIEEIIELYTDK